MKISWVTGWAIPKDIIKSKIEIDFPQHEHQVIYPGKAYKQYLEEFKPDHVIAHSLGSFLVINDFKDKFQKTLIAPFTDFKKESNKGGLIRTTQLKYLLKQLKSNPAAAVNDFYRRAGLPFSSNRTLPYPLEDLTWGIECLINQSTANQSNNDNVLLGSNDPLLDPVKIKREFPQTKIIENKGHNFLDFFEEIKNLFI